MNLDEYQKGAATTAIYPKETGLIYTTLGLSGEAGEIANKVKKIMRDGLTPDQYREPIARELGDVLWYVAMVAKELGYTLEDIAAGNLKDLADRQQRGAIGGSGDNR